MDVQGVLKRIGFTKNEIKVYIASLRLGPAKAGTIAKESELNRTGTYDALQKLLKKGVISFTIKQEVKWFQPENPKRLKQYLEEQQAIVNEVMPELEGTYKLPKEKQNVRLYKGLKSMKTVFEDIVREKKENWFFGSEGELGKRMPYFTPHFRKEIEDQNIKIRSLVRKGREDLNPSKTTQVKFLNVKNESPVAINIYGDKISIIIWSKTPEAIIIDNKEAANTFREYYEIMWKAGK